MDRDVPESITMTHDECERCGSETRVERHAERLSPRERKVEWLCDYCRALLVSEYVRRQEAEKQALKEREAALSER